MKNYRNVWTILIIISGSILLAYVYASHFQRGLEFWDNIVGISLSLIAGIPIALWIDAFSRKKETQKTLREEIAREKDVLLCIKQELDFNEARIKEGRDITQKNFHTLQTEMWEVLKSSGDLKLIKNVELLNRITSGYDIALKIKHFEEKALDDWNLGNRGMDIYSTWKIQKTRATEYYPLFLSSTLEAKKAIAYRLSEMN